MTWTYSGDPATSYRDEVRFWAQDVRIDRPLMSDEEIDFLLSTWIERFGSPIYVAAVVCEVIAAKYAIEVNVNADGVSVSVGDLQERYIRLAQRLRDTGDAHMNDQVAFDTHDIWSNHFNEALEPLVFGIGFTDNWEAGRQDYGNYHPGRWEGHPTGGMDPLAPKPIEGTDQ